jgi:hypothetical protein
VTASSIGSKIASTLQYEQPLSDNEVAGLAATFCEIVAAYLTEAPSALVCTARVVDGGLARRRLLATTIYSTEAETVSGAPINATLAAQLSTVDGSNLFTKNMSAAFPTAVVAPAWNVIPDVPLKFYQMELLSPAGGIYGDDGTLLLKFYSRPYVDGSVSLTFKSIAAGSIPRIHMYAVPLTSYTNTDFSKVIETKHHPTAPLVDGTYNLFVDYKMRKASQPRNATVQLIIDFDDCANATASCNNGTCVNGENTFSCVCNDGYSGDYCEMDVDDCIGVVCLNGALCQDLVGDFECTCPPTYFGKLCGSLDDVCAANDCVNGAECFSDDESAAEYSCECLDGYIGDSCSTDIDECAIDPCLNGATCENLVGSFNCSCVDGWEGDQCERNPNDCLVTEPCKNGASCKDLIGRFECACALGWSGADCTVDVDECLSFPCENGGTCAQGLDSGSFECTCVEGFQGNAIIFTQSNSTSMSTRKHSCSHMHN